MIIRIKEIILRILFYDDCTISELSAISKLYAISKLNAISLVSNDQSKAKREKPE